MRTQNAFFGAAVFLIAAWAAAKYAARWRTLRRDQVPGSDPRFRQLVYSILLGILMVLLAMARMHLI